VLIYKWSERLRFQLKFKNKLVENQIGLASLSLGYKYSFTDDVRISLRTGLEGMQILNLMPAFYYRSLKFSFPLQIAVIKAGGGVGLFIDTL
jgi:hypothetical protein